MSPVTILKCLHFIFIKTLNIVCGGTRSLDLGSLIVGPSVTVALNIPSHSVMPSPALLSQPCKCSFISPVASAR